MKIYKNPIIKNILRKQVQKQQFDSYLKLEKIEKVSNCLMKLFVKNKQRNPPKLYYKAISSKLDPTWK